jgi:predicted  nucleic acid-binding Zn-ribbon protein
VPQVTDIRTLQEIDDEAAALRAALDDVERRLRGSEQLDEARRTSAAMDAELADVRRAQRRIEGEVAGLTARIEPEEKRLYDGSVRNPKELQNIQHELENLKDQRAKLEDQLLEVMTNLDRVERDQAAATRKLAQEEARWEKDQGDLKHEALRLNDLITRTDVRREAQKLKVTPRNLHVYEDVRRRRGGVAVARVTGGNCGGCRVGIPEAIRKRAFGSDQLAQCPNCERILYVG